jgi:hypothetical protein
MSLRHLTERSLRPLTDDPVSPDRHDNAMTGNGRSHRRPTDEQRAFFEALVGMRDRYAHRGTDDAEPVIGVHHAIVAANTAMAHLLSPPARHPGIAAN